MGFLQSQETFQVEMLSRKGEFGEQKCVYGLVNLMTYFESVS